MISFKLLQRTRHSRGFSRMDPGLRSRQITTSTMLMTWLATVAMATPATSIWNTMTSSRFSATFTSPLIIR